MVEQDLSARDIDVLFAVNDERLRRWLERLGLVDGKRLRVGRVAVLSVAITWLPLLVLSVIEGVAWGSTPAPFLRDFLPYGQFLVAVPTLILGEIIIAGRLGWVVAGLRQSDVLSPTETPALDEALGRIADRACGWRINVTLLVLTLAMTIVSLWSASEWLTGTQQTDGARMTIPGWWYVLVSVPVLRFLTLLQLWRLIVWTWLLWRISRMDLRPQPIHPDRAGGLAFVGGAQASFGIFVFAIGVQLSCVAADAVRYGGMELMALKEYIVTYVLAAVVWPIIPLLVFTPKLVRARERYLVFFSSYGYEGGSHLETLLRGREEGELSHAEVSNVADYEVLYEDIRLMRPLPLEVRHVIFLIVAAILPFLPLVLLVMPATEVFRTAAKLLI